MNNVYPCVTMSSGKCIVLRKIRLYKEVNIISVAKLRSDASRILGPNGMMVGAIGTPSFGLAAEAAAISFVSGILAQAAKNNAINLLKNAQKLYLKLKSDGLLFDVEKIYNISEPNLGLWSAFSGEEVQEVDTSIMSKDEKDEFCNKYNIKLGWGDSHIVDAKMPIKYIHDGDEFVYGVSDDGNVCIRWSMVESYKLI